MPAAVVVVVGHFDQIKQKTFYRALAETGSFKVERIHRVLFEIT